MDIDFEKKILTVQVLDKRGRIYKRWIIPTSNLKYKFL